LCAAATAEHLLRRCSMRAVGSVVVRAASRVTVAALHGASVACAAFLSTAALASALTTVLTTAPTWRCRFCNKCNSSRLSLGVRRLELHVPRLLC
jgi:hypothetical protein